MKTVLALAGVAVLAAGCAGSSKPHFESASGWHAGSGGAYAWSATVAYRDCRNCVPPHRTIAALPPGGVVIQVSELRVRSNRDVGTWPPRVGARDVSPGFEGVPSRYGVAELDVRTGRIERYVYVWFGRAQPTPGQLAKANAELGRLSF